jgi:hypothetical protein
VLVAIGLVLAVTIGAVAALANPPAGQCALIAPRELPSGAEPGEVTTRVEDGRTVFTWGAGPDVVALWFGELVPGQVPPPPEARPAEYRTEVRGIPASVLPVGDLPESSVVIEWLVGNCHYMVSLAGGPTLAEALARAAEYARRY